MTIANSIFNPEFSLRFARLGYPTYLIAPLMTLKVFGLIAIWTNASKALKEWAYAGFFFLFALALMAELKAVDTDYVSPLLAIVLLLSSHTLCGKITKQSILEKPLKEK